MDVCWYNNYIGSKTQVQRLLLWLWFDLNPGIYLVISYNINLYNIAIAYLYNNNLTSVKQPCGREHSPYIYTKQFHTVILFSYWYG